MKTIKLNHVKSEQFLKRMFYLAWQASTVVGFGFLQDNSEATEEDVWKNIKEAGDYPANTAPKDTLNADYVFGRMMKLSVMEVKKKSFKMRDENYRTRYNSFSRKFKTADDLLHATAESLSAELEKGTETIYETS